MYVCIDVADLPFVRHLQIYLLPPCLRFNLSMARVGEGATLIQAAGALHQEACQEQQHAQLARQPILCHHAPYLLAVLRARHEGLWPQTEMKD